ncbi:hypothetical protein Tco_1144517 [Tanacetum coccineum]
MSTAGVWTKSLPTVKVLQVRTRGSRASACGKSSSYLVRLSDNEGRHRKRDTGNPTNNIVKDEDEDMFPSMASPIELAVVTTATASGYSVRGCGAFGERQVHPTDYDPMEILDTEVVYPLTKLPKTTTNGTTEERNGDGERILLDHLVKNIKEGKDKQRSGGKKDAPRDKADTIYMVMVGNKEHSTTAWMNFMVIRSPSPYNGIIGCPGTFSDTQSVYPWPSGCLIFPVAGGIVTILQHRRHRPKDCNTVHM